MSPCVTPAMVVLFILVWSLGSFASGPSSAASADRSTMISRIDALLAERWNHERVTPSPAASDAEFMRRVFLDLTGTLPRVIEVRAYLSSKVPNRHTHLIDAILGTADPSPEFAGRPDHWNHLATIWREFLLSAGSDFRFRQGKHWESWLRLHFRRNTPYDQMVRELLVAEGPPSRNGPALFYAAHQLKADELAGSTARALLGVQLQCAQCHDHPFDDWSQEDFWGFAAFFARLARTQNRAGLIGSIQDTSTGEIKLPDTNDVVPPRFLGGAVARDHSDLGITRRMQLAQWITSPQNPYFARATVNRVWSILFGRGIVHPVDDLGDQNPASHPELLNELADYFVQSRFDLRELIRTLACTRAYQLSSAGSEDAADRPELFAQMAVKPLTAQQLYDCLLDATIQREMTVTNNSRLAAATRVNDVNRDLFLNKFRAAGGSVVDYQSDIPQALCMMNGTLMRHATDWTKSDILMALTAPFLSDEQRIETLFLATVSRYPRPEEREKLLYYVASRDSTEAEREALSDILWALLNSAEFMFNR